MNEPETIIVRDEPHQRAPVYVERRSNVPWLIAIAAVVLAVVAAFAFGLIDIDQTRQTALPDVKVETSGGALPAFDVDTAKVNVETTTTSVDVPTVAVGTTPTEVEVPTVSVEPTSNPDN